MMRTNQTIPPSQQIQEETAVVNFLNAILIPFYFVFPGSLWSFCFGNRKKRIVPPSASHQLCRCGCFSSSNWFPLPLLMSTPFPHPCEQTWRFFSVKYVFSFSVPNHLMFPGVNSSPTPTTVCCRKRKVEYTHPLACPMHGQPCPLSSAPSSHGKKV